MCEIYGSMTVGIWEYDVESLHKSLKNAVIDEIEEHPLTFKELVVFGSYGRGAATESSDLDVLLVVSLDEQLKDIERRDLFEGISTSLDTKNIELPTPISEVDFLVSNFSNRDKVLRDCLEEVDKKELQDAPCLVYSLTDKKKREVLYP